MEENAEHATGRPHTRILAVVVLYGQSVNESSCFASLQTALRLAPSHMDCAVLVYDNTPRTEAPAAIASDTVCYQHATENSGLYGAYQAAFGMARSEQRDWLLTLDQDTVLPPDFFARLEPALDAALKNDRIGAIVPHLVEGERRLSPAYAGLGRARHLPSGFNGIPAGEVRAFNSAALLRVRALEDLGGFDARFWLDYLDCWLHHQLYMRAWKVYVVGDLEITHHLSLLNYGERMSAERYANFLDAEGAYVDLYCAGWERALYAAQLTVRALNQKRRGEDPQIQRHTRASIASRLRESREERLRRWRTAHRRGNSVTS